MVCANVVEMLSEAVKLLKGEYTVRAIQEHKMDKAIIFCRTKVDCDNMENYLISRGGGRRFLLYLSVGYGYQTFLCLTLFQALPGRASIN